MNNSVKYLTMIGAWSLFSLAPLNATMFPFNAVHSGGTPGGSPTWATMTITNISGGVTITLTHLTTDLTEPNRFIGQLNLNFTTLPTGFDFSSSPYITGISLGSYTNAGLPFNVEVRFKTAPPSERFTQGNTTSFTLFGVSESDFAGLNTSGMVHFRALAGGDSSKVIAPEPASMMVLASGLFGVLGLRRRKR